MTKIAGLAATTLAMTVLMSGSAWAHPLPASPHPWNKRVHCEETDPDGRHIVTRFGNADFGWNHFTHRHNIRKCRIVNAALRGNVDRNDHHGRLEYDGVAFRTGPHPAQVRYVVIVQHSRKTKDGKYDAGRGHKIGVINAFCRNRPNNKCPVWMNQ